MSSRAAAITSMSGGTEEGVVAKSARIVKEVSANAKEQVVALAQKVYPLAQEQAHRICESSVKTARASYHIAAEWAKDTYDKIPPSEIMIHHAQKYFHAAHARIQPMIENGGVLVSRASVHFKDAGGRLSAHVTTSVSQMKKYASSIAWSELLKTKQAQIGFASMLGLTSSAVIIIMLRRYSRPLEEPCDEDDSFDNDEHDCLYHRTVLTAMETQAKSSHGVAAMSKAGVKPGDSVCEFFCMCMCMYACAYNMYVATVAILE